VGWGRVSVCFSVKSCLAKEKMVDRCYMCKKNGESVNYLLLHCEVFLSFGMFSSCDLGCLGLCLDE
jgi:hypothetical protein